MVQQDCHRAGCISVRKGSYFRLLNELKEELLSLKAAASKGAIKLLEHIYTVHPPKQDRAGVSKKRDSSSPKRRMGYGIQGSIPRARVAGPGRVLLLKCVDHQSMHTESRESRRVCVCGVCVCVVFVCESLCVLLSKGGLRSVCGACQPPRRKESEHARTLRTSPDFPYGFSPTDCSFGRQSVRIPPIFIKFSPSPLPPILP